MIKAIFFDFDGVLTTNPSKHFLICKNLQQITGIPFKKIMSCYEPYILDLDRGRCTHSEIWIDFCRCLGSKLNISILEKAFLDVPINEKMFQLAKKLKHDYKIGIITNNTKERFDLINNKLNLNHIFDAITLSSEAGYRKPDGKELFVKALGSLNLLPEEAVFIDNTPKSLEIPKSMGFKTIHHDDKKNDLSFLIEELKKLGINI